MRLAPGQCLPAGLALLCSCRQKMRRSRHSPQGTSSASPGAGVRAKPTPAPHSPPFGWDSGRGPSFWRCWHLALIFSRASHLKCDYFHRTCYFCVDPQRWGIKRGSVAHLTSRPACWLAAPALPPSTPPACLNLCRVPTLSLVMWILFISKIPTLCHMY